MFPAFLAQYAAGCFLAVAISAIRQTGWRYLRLMCIVSCSIAMLALVFNLLEFGAPLDALQHPAAILLIAGLAAGFGWLFVNASQGETVRNSQRAYATAAGLACLTAALSLAIANASPNPTRLGAEHISHATWLSSAELAFSAFLGAGLLGVATAAMLLGHRYLTDTGMPIAPLRWITRIYIALFAARVLWVIAMLSPRAWAGAWPSLGEIYTWLALSVRLGVGLLVAGVFAYMIWDCVKRRATQSATALYYLSMLFIFFGELTAQYLSRTEGWAL